MVTIDHGDDDQHWTVRGLVLPASLISLLKTGGWRNPDESALRALIPWFRDPLIFLTSVYGMRRESASMDLFADDEPSAELFREVRGSQVAHPVELPWLDVEQAVLIAVNRNPGDDVALALDYRTDRGDPRVVGSDFWTNPKQCSWRVVTPTFTELVVRLDIR
ncbi:MAG: hypothetical protein ACRDT6_17215 [Micromonosporaceae bacterium]